jgi:hypothetical protein
MEHPADPALHHEGQEAKQCASIWATKCVKEFQRRHNMLQTTFSQCQLGMETNKPTTLLTRNMHGFRRLNNWMCTHRHWRNPDLTSKDLSRWAWELNEAIAATLKASLPWLQQYIERGSLPDTNQDTVRQ